MQLFGEIETQHGKSKAMLCVDDDCKQEWMLHMWEGGAQKIALLCDATVNADTVTLRPKLLYRPNSSQSMHLPSLSNEEVAMMQETTAVLKHTETGYIGQWKGPTGEGTITLHEPKAQALDAEVCNSWDEFSTWAQRVRIDHEAVIFRGHGDRQFKLKTTLHRQHRNRMERYCLDVLPRFKSRAEATMGMRFDFNNGEDYATVLGLAQHHGLPTPMLDWTESPYVAAFFAFSDTLAWGDIRRDVTHVRVFALTRKFVQMTSPATVSIPQINHYVSSLQIAPIHNPRLLAQQGRFLVTNVSDLESFLLWGQEHAAEKFLVAVDMPVHLAVQVLEDLAYMGLHAGNLFPGLDGVSTMLKHEMVFTRHRIAPAGMPVSSAIGTSNSDDKEQEAELDARPKPEWE